MNSELIRVAASACLVMLAVAVAVMPASGARWWASNQLWWSVGPACRDGALVHGRFVGDQAQIGEEYPFAARLYDGGFPSYPVIATEDVGSSLPVIDVTKLGDQIGAVTLVKQPVQEAPLVYDHDGETGFTHDYTVDFLSWRQQQRLGKIVSVKKTGTIHFVLEIEDCYLASDAEERRVSLALRATVGNDPDTCTDATSLAADPGEEVYLCLIMENSGDVTYASHEVTGNNYAIDDLVDFTLTPGTEISITHGLAVDAGLDLNLGPFVDSVDVTNEVIWVASGENLTASDTAQVTVLRNATGRVYLPLTMR